MAGGWLVLVFVVLMRRRFSVVGVFALMVMGVTVDHITMFVFMVMRNYCWLFVSQASATFAHMLLLVFVPEVLSSANMIKDNPFWHENKVQI